MLKKNNLIQQSMVDYAKFEIDVMKNYLHPNILPNDFVKQQPNSILLLSPFAVGGDLAKFMKKNENTP
jgi:hypothetical protein